jgi:hypothetical protein
MTESVELCGLLLAHDQSMSVRKWVTVLVRPNQNTVETVQF